MIVERYMQREVTTVTPETSLAEVRRVMEEHGFGLLLIASSSGQLEGFVTRGSLKDVSDWDQPVSRVSHPARFAVGCDDTLEKAALIMLDNRLVLLPVTEDGRLLGVITQSEVLRGLASGLGIGKEATRLTIRMPADDQGIYRALDVIREHGGRLVSLCQATHGSEMNEWIIRVQGIEDREALREILQQELSRAAA